MNAQKLSLPLLIVLAILPSLLVGQQTENSGCNSRRGRLLGWSEARCPSLFRVLCETVLRPRLLI